MPTAISLFTGCMGLDLGLEEAGWDILWACESDPACRKVIRARRPGLEVLPDVREIDAGMPRADLLAGGFPCQDLSYAGRGRGLDGERSALWFNMADAIRLLRPRNVLVENVPGLTTRGIGRVLYDLAEAGYVGSAIRLRASDLGAPHIRERVFILASLAEPELAGVDTDARVHGGGPGEPRRPAQAAVPAGAQVPLAAHALEDRRSAPADPGGDRQFRQPTCDRTDGGVGVERGDNAHRRDLAGTGPGDRHSGQDAADADKHASRRPLRGVEGQGRRSGTPSDSEAAADADSAGRQEQRWPVPVGAQVGPAERGGGETAADADTGGRGGRAHVEGQGSTPRGGPAGDGWQAAADTDGEPGEPGRGWRASGGDHARPGPAQRDGDGLDGEAEPGEIDWGIYAEGIDRWSGIIGRRPPLPTDPAGRLEPGFVEWMLGFPEGWTAVDGVTRTDRLKMLGNSVQVQCAELVGELLLA